MRNYLLIGQIKGAKVVTRTDKTTKQVTATCEVIIQYEDFDKDGELVLDTDTIQFPVDELDNFKKNLNKFVVVPHLFLTTKSGTYLFPDENMNYHIFNSNPLIPVVTEKKAS
eukprot:TRINITY_DN5575_c0_g1_i2.p2 TRINITY_DN5575_c0_g1~~TRINITY_DN5575_c0_g1_i2.p2  ORF type:complete len:112 (-),score=21.70 TRINITY_DN5575_c0_g1_i2:524-859(-)